MTLKQFEAKLAKAALVETNIPASSKDIQEQIQHMGDVAGKVVMHEHKNRKDRRFKDQGARLLNNRGGAGQAVWHRMAMFGMKLTNYKLGMASTRFTRVESNIKGIPPIIERA